MSKPNCNDIILPTVNRVIFYSPKHRSTHCEGTPLTRCLLLSVLVITGLRMAALRNAVSPDFTYSQSYLSLLSSTGCMIGVICCASIAIRAVIQRVRQHKVTRSRRSPDLHVGISAPIAVNNGDERTVSGQEDGGYHCDLEKGSNSGVDTDGEEQPSTQDAVSEDECTINAPGDEFSHVAVALINPSYVSEPRAAPEAGRNVLGPS